MTVRQKVIQSLEREECPMLCLEIADIQMVLKASSLTQSSKSVLKLTSRPKCFLFSLIGLSNLQDGVYLHTGIQEGSV